MYFYILQQSDDNFLWFDLKTDELYLLKKYLIIFRNKYPSKYYRIVRLYR